MSYGSHMHGLPSISCPECGASLPVDPLAPTVTCAHCDRTCAVPDALRARAAEYVARIRAAWADALEAQRAAILHRQAAGSTPRFWRWFVLFALSAPLAIMIGASNVAGRLPFGAALLVVLGLGIVWWRFTATFLGLFRPPSVGMVLASGLGECRNCGAPVRLPEGEVRTSCDHCGATLLATAELKRALVGAALERVRAEAHAHGIAVRAHLDVAYDARAAYGVRGEISTVTTVLLVVGALALTGGIIWFMMALPPGPPDAGTWVCPALSVGALAMLVWFGLAVRDARRDVLAFERVIGRRLRPLPASGARK